MSCCLMVLRRITGKGGRRRNGEICSLFGVNNIGEICSDQKEDKEESMSLFCLYFLAVLVCGVCLLWNIYGVECVFFFS